MNNMQNVRLIQAGMGVGISSAGLARACAVAGEGAVAGVVSDTAIGHIAAMKLSEKDPDWLLALEQFGELIPEAAQLLERYVGNSGPLNIPLYTRNVPARLAWLTIFGSYANVVLASRGHDFPIGVNVLEKIQFAHLACFMGIILAMTKRSPGAFTFVTAGAGLAIQFPQVLEDLAMHRKATYQIDILREQEDDKRVQSTRPDVFDLDMLTKSFSTKTRERLAQLTLRAPPVVAVVTMYTAVYALEKGTKGNIYGYVVENKDAGGHNANPRNGESYGPKDEMDLEKLRKLGKPFWVAGDWAAPDRFALARSIGAQGIQVGSLFVPTEESGLIAPLKRSIIRMAKDNSLVVVNDPLASPTGFRFMVAKLPETVGEPGTAATFVRGCFIGQLRTEVELPSGKVIYLCAAEPEKEYVKKGGLLQDTQQRQCLCRQLYAGCGGQLRRRNTSPDPPIVTLGLFAKEQVRAFLEWNKGHSYTAARVVLYLIG